MRLFSATAHTRSSSYGRDPRICTLPRTIIVIPANAGIQLLQQNVITGLDPVIFSRVAGDGRIKSGHDVL